MGVWQGWGSSFSDLVALAVCGIVVGWGAGAVLTRFFR